MTILTGDCLKIMPTLGAFDCVIADPPDNIGLQYGAYVDSVQDDEYARWLADVLAECSRHAPIVWLSFNARWTAEFGRVVCSFLECHLDWTYRACVQHFRFGQHNHHWLANCHRPCWCIHHRDARFYPDAVRVPSARQTTYNDKRADARGRVPGDVLEFSRVCGTFKQRRRWHPTQLNEKLIEFLVRFSTREGGSVLDPFGGSGTTARVCDRIGRDATLIEIDPVYVANIRSELEPSHQ